MAELSSYGLPAEGLQEALSLAGELLHYQCSEEQQKTPSKRMRALERSLKKEPDNNDLRAEVFALRAECQSVVFDAGTRSIFVVELPKRRAESSQEDRRLNAAVAVLRDFWESQGREVLCGVNYLQTSEFLLFLGDALRELGVHGTKLSPDALKSRLYREKGQRLKLEEKQKLKREEELRLIREERQRLLRSP